MALYLPKIAQKWNEALEWSSKICDSRLEREGELSQHKDAFSRFIRAARAADDAKSLDRLALYGDAFSITVAGSHTVGTTLTMLFFELARHPDAQRHVREEIHSVGYHGEINEEAADYPDEKYPFLNACINETLRLYPGVPTGGIRQTTERGMHIGDRWIPPYTMIVTPRWTLGRRKFSSPFHLSLQVLMFCSNWLKWVVETAFELPDQFIPERWTSKTYLVKDARAFNGFGFGKLGLNIV